MKGILHRYAIMAAVMAMAFSVPVVHAQAAAEGNPLQLKPDHATILVTDLDAESAWYQKALGFQESRRLVRSAVRTVAYLTISGYRLDLIKQSDAVKRNATQYAFELGYLNIVFRTPAIDAAYEHLAKLGINVRVDRDAQKRIEHLTFFDPEGNEIGIAPER